MSWLGEGLRLRPAAIRRPFLALALLGAVLAAAGCGEGAAPQAQQTPRPTPGATPVPAVTVDLASATDVLTVFGAEAGDFLADRFALAAGDFNGDGKGDLLLGAPLGDGPNNGRMNAGEAYVLFGSSEPRGTVDLASGRQDLTIFGRGQGDNLGFVVARGDVNGDGIDDALVGARFASPDANRAQAGEAYVIFGSATLGGTVDIAGDEQDATIAGAASGDFLGYALASGDINGDDVDDVLAAAAGGDGPDDSRESGGEAYVVLGSPSLSGRVDVAAGQQAYTIWGAEPEDLLANFAASGDVNGDGMDDILLGTHKADGPDNQRPDGGEAYVILGARNLKGTLDLAEGKDFLSISGGAAQDWLGFYLAAADVNGDGTDDIIVGARNADGPDDTRNNSGEVYVLFGASKLPKSIDIAREQQDVTIVGGRPGDLLGHALAAGDINGDGVADVLAGAPTAAADGRRTEAGQVLAFFGSSAWPAVVDAAAGQANVIVSGAEAGDELGFSVASADINGDGVDDIIAGALLADGPDNARQDGGEAYLVLGRP
ncbi:MAG: hypothetical protein Q8P22_12725 [Chloroflexota bacterium]|nr:hypothetical protein [Chloroflexota bacterium]